MRKLSILLQFILVFGLSQGYGQTILFSEDFESGEIPLNWKQEFVKGSINWRYENGGYSLNPEIPNSRKPIAAHGGEFNALFQFQSSNNEATKLVTKKIDAIEFAVKPELHFYHAQYDWKHGADYYHDYLRVYYKTTASGAWKLLNEYTSATTDWVERIIVLPDNDLSADYHLAFEGETKWGWGACVDDITIVETGIKPKTLSNISVEQASDVPVSSGTTHNPILKVKLKVTGNSGSLPVNSLTLKSLNTSDSDIETGGVKIFFTQDAEFNADNQVGTGVSFSSGQAVFNNLNYQLPTGYSYLWVTYDVKLTAGHRNTLDAKFASNSINIGGNTYFFLEQSPVGSRTILQSIHADDYESALNWDLSGEFEYGSPQGLGGSQGNPDPGSAFSGSKIMGTDLTGLGDYPGDYEKNLIADDYTATSDTFDFTYYNDLSIRYMRFLNIGVNDEASVDISPDGGKTWQTAWTNSSMILDDKWKLHEIDITNQAARKEKVLVRYSLGTTNDYWQLSGWNIDNFSITGNYVSKDVGVSRVVSPMEGCGHTASDSVTVIVKNFGALITYGVIPVQYSFDGNKTIVRDTLYQEIAFGDSVMFTFKKKVDLSVPDIYDFRIGTGMDDDDDPSNDGIAKLFYVQPSIQDDFTETFESRGGLWIPHEDVPSNWEWGAPGYGIVPPSGSKLWMTKLLSYYPDRDSSFLESACYRNLNSNRKILQLKYWSDTETGKDGAAVQYTTDNGVTWHLLDTLISEWNWYTGSVQSLNSRGWSGNSEGWIKAREVLPENLTHASSMKFRLTFASDAENNDIGFAFDDFSITTAPPDIGISQIDSFATRCQNLNPDRVTVVIRNFGINPVRMNDSIIVGFDLNQVKIATDTFTLGTDLLPGQVVRHTFMNPVDASVPGNYNLTAYTLSEDDPYYYGANNDSLSLDFEVLVNPITMLTDTIATRQPDTVMIKSFYDPDYDYLWSDMSTGPEYDVEHAGWYTVKVTATRGNGCISRDSSYVLLLFNDVGVDSLIHPYNHCGLSQEEYIRLQVKNFGTDVLAAGEKIALTYVLNSGIPVSDTLILTQPLQSGQKVSFTFTGGAADLSSEGIYNFSVFSSFNGDTIQTNDTLDKAVEIYGHPDVYLGPDITVKALSHTLDAGSGYISYAWDNGATTQTREITEPGNYWVRVLDENQCDNSDTAYVWLKIRDIRPDVLVSPVSDCRFTGTEPVTLRVLNAGTDTIPTGEHITVSYSLNEGIRINESFDLAGLLLPGENTTHTFTGNVNLTDTADYQFEATAVMGEDMRVSNDTADLVIYRYPKPEIDFGLDEIEYVQDIEFPVDAGYSPFYSYQWQDNYSEHLYMTTRSGNYWVKATDTRTFCYDGDTVTVFLIYNDIGVTSTNLPAEGCTGEFNQVVVSISNLGTSNIGKDVPIYVACDMNGERIALDTLIRSGNFLTNSTLDLVLSAPVIIHESGFSEVAFHTLYGSDMKSWNDTLAIGYSALPSPEIDFGDVNGILQVDLPHLLDAGSGHKAYLWQNGSTNQSFTATSNGTYSVTVTGQNDCQTSRTVQINPVTGIRDIQSKAGEVILYPNPNNGLFYLSISSDIPEDLTVHVVNSQGQTVYNRVCTASSLLHEPIDIQHLPAGIYHIVIMGNGQLYNNKMMIQ